VHDKSHSLGFELEPPARFTFAVEPAPSKDHTSRTLVPAAGVRGPIKNDSSADIGWK
jgi:hypothetical protein